MQAPHRQLVPAEFSRLSTGVKGIYQPRTTGTVRIDPGGTVHVDNPGIATDDDGALIFDWQGYTS